jgi:KaiC/GvpD/RAD55 family RecA-like ATPase
MIENILPKNSLAVLYGEPGSGKTFVALSIALSIAAGHNWCGIRTEKGLVVYVAAEGVAAFKARTEAYEKKHQIGAKDIRYGRESFDLLDPYDVAWVLNAIQAAGTRPNLIILDTFARLTVGADENSSGDMGRAVDGIDRMRKATSATVLLIHHTTKTGRTERGSSVLRGAADLMIECRKMGGTVQLDCDKMKDAEPFAPLKLILYPIDLGTGQSSLAIGPALSSASSAHVYSPRATQALQVLLAAFGSGGASYSQWKKEFVLKTGTTKTAFDRARTELETFGKVKKHNSKYYAQP